VIQITILLIGYPSITQTELSLPEDFLDLAIVVDISALILLLAKPSYKGLTGFCRSFYATKLRKPLK